MNRYPCPIAPRVLAMIAAMTLWHGAQAVPTAPAITKNGLFGTIEIPSDNLRMLTQWTDVIKRWKSEQQVVERCDREARSCHGTRMTVWRAKVAQLRNSPVSTKLWEVNKFVNSWPMESDERLYQKPDYWAAPLEFLNNGGDSEDFAIMKFFMLRELGIPNDELRIVVTRDVLRDAVDIVVAASYQGKRYILAADTNTVRTDRSVRFYIPYFSMNETTRWAHIPNKLTRLP